jgi:DNA processing protein
MAAGDERPYWIMLAMATGIGPVRFQRLLEVCGGAEAAWHASDFEMAAAGLERRTADGLRRVQRSMSPESAVARLENLGLDAVTLLDHDYPASLRQIADPPPVLFVKGRLPPVDTPAVALVGTRRATPYGRTVAERLARDLAQAGVAVVSGLARGVDTVAHQAALEAGGCTLAVLGNGLDQVYPAENSSLAGRIVGYGQGALVSEFPPGVPPDALNFPRRNRLISGLSAGAVIIEAGVRSGALITADFSLEQGRDVFAVPGSIFSAMSFGPNELLKQGATPVTCAQDILDALNTSGPAPMAHSLPRLDEDESCIWEALAGDPRHIDDLARELKRGAGEVSATLTLLELKGLARQVGAMTYARV